MNGHDIKYELVGQRFTWDNTKAVSNVVKHGITFEEAASVFILDSVVYFEDALHSYRRK